MAEVRWRRLVYLGHRGDATAWRAQAAEGGEVLFIVPVDQLPALILGLHLEEPLIGADPSRHEGMLRLLQAIGLRRLAGAYRPVPPSGLPTGVLRPPTTKEEG